MYTILELGGPTLQAYYLKKIRDSHDRSYHIDILTNIVRCAAIALEQFHQRGKIFF